MGSQSLWEYSDIPRSRTPKIPHKVALVTPRMDVDVTGVSLKNVRTHLIDHPRDEGLRHREQLWNFQQRYRGAIGKLKNLPGLGGGDDSRSNESDDCLNDDSRNYNIRTAFCEQPSLQSRVRQRLSRKVKLTTRRPREYSDLGLRTSSSLRREELPNGGIQRLYSSGLIVKNSLISQLRGESEEERRINPCEKQIPDDSRLLEAIERYGSLERLPDIPITGSSPATARYTGTPLNQFTRSTERRIPLRRSYTNLSDIRSSRRKLLIVSRRGQQERFVQLGCIDSDNDDDDDDDDDDDGDDEEDECDNETQIARAEKLHVRDCNKKRPEHIAIRSNITQVNTEEDMELLDTNKVNEASHKDSVKTDTNFVVDSKSSSLHRKLESTRQSSRSGNNGNASSDDSDQSVSKTQNHQNKKSDKEDKLGRQSQRKNSKKEKTEKIEEKEERPDSGDSLDIPRERFGSTTHSTDKKLSIRKPWEWRPSPFRWTDKASVRESDKPYIERILNRGEIIDEFNYDSYARTKPLKLQNYPEHAGYKDRYGVMR